MAGALNLLLLQEERRAMYEEAGETYEGPLKIANAMFVSRDGKVNESFAKQFETVFGGKLSFTLPSLLTNMAFAGMAR